jgi:hypothetical protein
MGTVCVGALSGFIVSVKAFVGFDLGCGVCGLLHPLKEAYFVGVFALVFTGYGTQHSWHILLSMMYILCYNEVLVLHVSLVLSYFIYLFYE